jgi:glucose-6-phosphate-specific signal transduction histidine kinase
MCAATGYAHTLNFRTGRNFTVCPKQTVPDASNRFHIVRSHPHSVSDRRGKELWMCFIRFEHLIFMYTVILNSLHTYQTFVTYIQNVVFSWKESWLTVAFTDLINVMMVFHIGATFGPVNDLFMTRAFNPQPATAS